MPNDTYYIVDDKHCLHEGMTREQIINAIAEATGATPQAIDEGFISTVVETNHGTSIHIWKGTAAEYAALETHDANTWYIITDDTSIEDMQAAIDNMGINVGSLQTAVGGLNTDVGALQTDVGTLQTDIGSLQTDVGGLDTDVDDLQGRMTDAETGIGGINGKIGAQNGIASLDGSGHVPSSQIPVGGWANTEIDAADIPSSGYSISISFARARVMMSFLNTKIDADYTKSTGTLYGIKLWDDSRQKSSVGDVCGDNNGFNIISVTANATGLKIEKLGTTSATVKVWIRQEA